MKRLTAVPFAASLLALTACAQATTEPTPLDGAWTVDSAASHLAYVTVKSGEIAETNEFTGLSGSVAADGAAVIEVDLASVSTGVDIRDERMRDIFFDVATNPSATVTAQLDPAQFANLAIGETAVRPISAQLSLAGVERTIETELAVTRAAENRVLAVTTDPVIIYADAYGLSDGLAQLQELAGLPSITPATPVTFSIAFQR